MAHAAVVRSERAHAYITGIDRAEAEAAPGVIAVVTADDLGDLGRRFGHIVPDHCVLADGKVRYYGEPVAVVVAETPHEAADAAALVWVDYDDLPALTDAARALASDVLIHEQSYVEPGQEFLGVAPAASAGNVAHRDELAWGDAEAALIDAATVVETTAKFPLVYGYAMETYNALADWQPGSLHVVSTAQHPLMVRKELARMFSLPLAAVRVEVPYIGGGYGSKSYTKLEPLAAAASWASGRPVKVTTDVEAAMYTTRADGALVTVRTGFDAGARITARDIDIRFDTGAYADNSPLVLTKSINRSFGPYRMPNLRVRGVAVYTNTSPASSYRGFGAPQAALAGELNMDMAADRLGIDPVELRRRNLLAPGDTLIAGKRPLDADLVADLDAIVCALESHAADRDAAGSAADSPAADRDASGGAASEAGVRRGWAVAVTASDAGASPISTAQVRMHADGSVTLLVSSTEMGQGSRTALAKIAARELHVDLDAVAVGQSDTRFTPFDWTTGASRTTTVVGLAVQAACADVWDTLRAKAAESASVALDDVQVRDGLVHVRLSATSESDSGSESGADLAISEGGCGSESGADLAISEGGCGSESGADLAISEGGCGFRVGCCGGSDGGGRDPAVVRGRCRGGGRRGRDPPRWRHRGTAPVLGDRRGRGGGGRGRGHRGGHGRAPGHGGRRRPRREPGPGQGPGPGRGHPGPGHRPVGGDDLRRRATHQPQPDRVPGAPPARHTSAHHVGAGRAGRRGRSLRRQGRRRGRPQPGTGRGGRRGRSSRRRLAHRTAPHPAPGLVPAPAGDPRCGVGEQAPAIHPQFKLATYWTLEAHYWHQFRQTTTFPAGPAPLPGTARRLGSCGSGRRSRGRPA